LPHRRKDVIVHIYQKSDETAVIVEIRARAQTVMGWLFTAQAHFQFQVTSSDRGGRSGATAGFLLVSSVSLC
jgi:hypothetical protein